MVSDRAATAATAAAAAAAVVAAATGGHAKRKSGHEAARSCHGTYSQVSLLKERDTDRRRDSMGRKTCASSTVRRINPDEARPCRMAAPSTNGQVRRLPGRYGSDACARWRPRSDQQHGDHERVERLARPSAHMTIQIMSPMVVATTIPWAETSGRVGWGSGGFVRRRDWNAGDLPQRLREPRHELAHRAPPDPPPPPPRARGGCRRSRRRRPASRRLRAPARASPMPKPERDRDLGVRLGARHDRRRRRRTAPRARRSCR